jgi:serine/threonine protein kinase
MEEVLRYAIEIGSALHKIHARGLVHGALSPFCIALAEDGARILESTPSPEDHAAYRAPEQLRGEGPDMRSDVFAYGALVYEIASGKRAFPGVREELAQRILTQPPVPLSSLSPISAAEAVIAMHRERSALRRGVSERGDRIEAGGGRCPTREKYTAARVRPVPSPAPNQASGGPAPAVPHLLPWASAARSAVAQYWAESRNAIYGLRLRRRVWVIGAAVLALAATSVAGVMFLQRRPAPAVLKFAVFQPENTSYPGMSSVSPDGRYLTFSAVGPEGKRMLWLRPLDALHATLIQGQAHPLLCPIASDCLLWSRFLMKVRLPVA